MTDRVTFDRRPLRRTSAAFPPKHDRCYLLNQESPNDQLRKIFETLGMPTEERWSGYSKLPLVVKVAM